MNERKSFLVISVDKANLQKWALIVILTLPHFNPQLFDYLKVDYIVNAGRVISALIVLFIIIISNFRPSKIFFLILLQQSYILIITLINQMAFVECLKAFISVTSVLLIYELFIDDRRTFISAQLFCFESMVYINALSIILHPDGMYSPSDVSVTMIISKKCWFLGYYNFWIVYFAPAFLVAMLYMYETGKKIRSFLLIICMLVSAVYVWSGAVIVSLIAMLLLYLGLNNLTRIFNYFTYWMSQVAFILLVLSVGMSFRLFDVVVGGWLNKANSLLLRINLWGKYVRYITSKPIFGYGYTGSQFREEMTGIKWAAHAHNLILETLFQGGILNLLLMIFIIVIAGKELMKYKNEKVSKIIATAFAGWCMDSYMETYTTVFLMGMFVIAYRLLESEKLMPEKIILTENEML